MRRDRHISPAINSVAPDSWGVGGGGGSTLCRGEHSQFCLIALALARNHEDLLLFEKENLSFLLQMQAVAHAERSPEELGRLLRCDVFWGGGGGRKSRGLLKRGRMCKHSTIESPTHKRHILFSNNTAQLCRGKMEEWIPPAIMDFHLSHQRRTPLFLALGRSAVWLSPDTDAGKMQ